VGSWDFIGGGNISGNNLLGELEEVDINPEWIVYDQDVDMEFMKVNFQSISWAQFAIFDDFADSSRRLSPESSTYKASVNAGGYLSNGVDVTINRVFGFNSKKYTSITTIESGTSTSVGLNFLADTGKVWYTNQCKNLVLTDSTAASFTVVSNTSNTLTVVGSPAAGAYTLTDDDPGYAVCFATYLDSTNGGYGYTKLEVTFDYVNYQTFLDTFAGINLLEGTVAIASPGHDFAARITLTNDAAGKGSILYKFLVCTDPSPWRF
jgi:hypothetical protein